MQRQRCWSLLGLGIVLLAAIVGLADAKSATGDRVLVIHEEATIESEFSQFFETLTGALILYGHK
jgi:hypothetical protein